MRELKDARGTMYLSLGTKLPNGTGHFWGNILGHAQAYLLVDMLIVIRQGAAAHDDAASIMVSMVWTCVAKGG